MSGTVVVLEAIPALGLKTCEPNLMPFHISYSGPALVSTFMDVKPAKGDEPGMPAPQEPAEEGGGGSSVDEKDGVVEESTDEKQDAADKEAEAPMVVDASQAGGEAVVFPPISSSTRTVSTFRGRTIQGLKVDLPQGYGGLVLQAPPAHTTTSASSSSRPPAAETHTAASSPKSKLKAAQEDAADVDDEYPTARSTRRRGRLARSAVSTKAIDVEKEEGEEAEKNSANAKQIEAIDVDEEAVADMDVDAGAGQDGSSPQRRIKPVAQFSSFTIWHPDNPVVEMQDEYYRSVHEWTALAAALHQGDDEEE